MTVQNISPITPTIMQTNTQVQTNPTKANKNTQNKIITASAFGLVALASSGMYLVNKKSGTNVQKAFNQLKNNINSGKTFIQTLNQTNLKPKYFTELMFKITSDNDLSKHFIKEVTAIPQKSKINTRILANKMGGDTSLLNWIHGDNGYQKAYSNYTKDLFDKPETKIDDVMKLSPNWNVWKLKEKFGEDFTFGELPQEFGDKKNYRENFETLRNESQNNFGDLKMSKYILGGLSGKGIRILESKDKKYILKYQTSDYVNGSIDKRNAIDLKDNTSMKSDSTLLNAQTERFLELNGYTQGPKLKFFDYKTNSAIYEMSMGEKPKECENILKTNKKLGELNNLGIYYNDVQEGNFLTNNNKLSFIDSGESTFIDTFKPGASGYNFTSPNLNGHSISDSAAAIMLSKTK